MSNLKPCPFCGGNANVSEWPNNNYPVWEAVVTCERCGIEGEKGSANNRAGCFDAENGLHKCDAIRSWNSRPSENKIKADTLREATNDILGYAGLTDYYNQFIERASKLEEGKL